jgi:hypothetical protein
MFHELAKYRIIFVTGPNRSGTTICAQMIAHDTGHSFVIEDEFGFSRLVQLAAFVQSDCGPLVIQCPFISHQIDDLKYLIDLDYDDVLVVMMHRYRRDIVRSEMWSGLDFRRIEAMGKARYLVQTNAHLSDVKYLHWEDQCQNIPHAMDVGYESLKGHPLWMDDRSTLPFAHRVGRPKLPKVFQDGILAIQNLKA